MIVAYWDLLDNILEVKKDSDVSERGIPVSWREGLFINDFTQLKKNFDQLPAQYHAQVCLQHTLSLVTLLDRSKR